MSYRVLFGQKRGSRRKIRAALKGLKDKNMTEYDSLLDLVCAKFGEVSRLPVGLWPVTCRSFEGLLQEQGSYSSQDDFPLFGKRLAKLQEFIVRQQPSELSDLWRDRRSPLQWYTFWAVLIVGGISILLGLIQTLIGAAQLAVGVIALNK